MRHRRSRFDLSIPRPKKRLRMAPTSARSARPPTSLVPDFLRRVVRRPNSISGQWVDRMKSNQTGRPSARCLASDRNGSDEVEVTTEPENFTSGIQPRGMTKKAAAAYCGCASLAAFDDWV